MAKAFCLIPEKVLQFKQALKDGTVDPLKLSQMTSEERNTFLKKIVGDDNATGVNSLFESKLLLKNQKAGMISWAKKVGGLTPEAKRDLFTKIEKLDKVLNPEDEKMFLRDLASTRLGTNVSPTEAKTIFDLSKKVQEAKALQAEDLTFKTDAERLAYGRAKVALSNYVNDIKEVNSKLTLKERMNPTNYLNNLSDIAGNAKSIKASLDNGALFQQGWRSLITHPLTWQKNARKTYVDIVKTFGGKKVMDEVNADIISRPTYDLMQKAKLAVGTIEEAFPGTVAEKLPLLGRVFKASEAAYTGFLYRQRADIFEKYIQIAKSTGVDLTKNELEKIGSMINSLTGRGNLGRFEGSAAAGMNNILFSPRLFKSRFDAILHPITGAGGTNLASGSNFVRKQASINLLKQLSAIGVVWATAEAMKPGSVEKDSNSTNFGRINIYGDTWIDPTGGFAGIATLASRLYTGRMKTQTGKEYDLNSGDFGAPTKQGVLWDFFANKASPVARVFLDLLKGEDFDGRTNPAEIILNGLFVPIGVDNAPDLLKDKSGLGIIGAILNSHGISASTILPKPPKENSWIEKPTKAQEAFKGKVSETQFKDANAIFNQRYESWQKEIENNPTYKKLDTDKQNGVKKSARERIQDQVFKEYGFSYKAPKKTREDLQNERELEKAKPKKVSQSIMDMLIPTASADEGFGGSSTYSFRDGQQSTIKVEEGEGIISKIIKAVTSVFESKPEVKPEKDYSKMKLTVTVGDKFVNEQKGGSGDIPELKATPSSKGNWKSKHEDTWNKVLDSKSIDKTVGTLIARSENGKEIANYANLNHGNMAGTFDIGLTQVNIVPPPEIKSKIIADTKNMSQAQANVYINKLIDDGVITGEAEKLRNPEYAINKAAELYEARLKNLGDPVLAIASYNLGSGGAVLSPKKALDRAKYVYNNAGLELPKTPFTEDPEGFVEKNMDKYKSIGLIRR